MFVELLPVVADGAASACPAQETLELQHASHTKTDEVSITTLDFPDNETTTFWVGTEEGNVYQANRYDRAGAKAGLNQHDIYKGHSGPVTGLHFHPLVGSVDFSDLFLTCSVDWTVKLWRAKGGSASANASSSGGAGGAGGSSVGGGLGTSSSSGVGGIGGTPAGTTNVKPVHSFEEATDYVYDVRWHPVNPAVFGSVDGTGKFDLWNLNVDTEVSHLRSNLISAALPTDTSFLSGSHPLGPDSFYQGAQQASLGPQGRPTRRARILGRDSLHLRHWRDFGGPQGVGVE